jgi:hypothetical protein
VNDGHCRRIRLVEGGNPSADRLEVRLLTKESIELTEGVFEESVEEVGRVEGQVDGISRCELIDEVICLNKHQ